ncbi:hypothetical protein D9M68_833230 [compost metagenome]
MEGQHIVGLLRLTCERTRRGRLPPAFGLVGRVSVFDVEIRVLPDLHRPVSDGQLHLVAARGPVAPAGHDGDVGDGLVLARFQEEDVAGGRHLPCNAVAESDMSNFLVRRELDLHRRTQRTDDPGDVVGLVIDKANAAVLRCAARDLQGERRRCNSGEDQA